MIFRIALRYLFSRKSHRVVNVISSISIAGVAVATAAIVVVLSVFNGFTGLAKSHLSEVVADVRVSMPSSKAFAGSDSLCRLLEQLPEVAVAGAVLQERALLAAGEGQVPVVVKGVDPVKFPDITDIDTLLLDGIYRPDNGMPDSVPGIQVSVGVAMGSGLRPSPLAAVTLYMPRRLGRINPANPAAAYRQMDASVTGVFRVDDQDFDNEYVFAPLDDVRRLLEYEGDEASAIELKAAPGVSPGEASEAVASALGSGFTVLPRDRQQAETFRMIAVEKWVTFLMLVFILIIAAFNIVSTLSLMVIEKTPDMSTLRAMGATRHSVRSIFIAEGWLITIAGGVAGTIAGSLLALLQQHFGLIRLNADPTALSTDVYPVELQAGDIAAVLVTVAAVGLLIGLISRLFTRKIS